MKAIKHNQHPIDLNDFYRGRLTVVGGRDFDEDVQDEDYTEAPVPSPTFRTNLLKLRRSVSEKLFSIEFKNINF